MIEFLGDKPLLIGILTDVSGSMQSSIGTSGTAAINRLEAFSEALERLVKEAAGSVREVAHSAQAPEVRLYAYGFGFRNPISVLPGDNGPAVRDLLANGGSGGGVVDVIRVADNWNEYLANVRGMALKMFGDTPMREGFERVRQTILEEIARQPSTSVLFVLSDGDPTDGNATSILPIVAEIRNTGTTVVSCFVTASDITEPKRLYGQARDAWSDAAKLMFECASNLERGTTFDSQFREYDWRVDPGARLFAQVNQSEMLSEFLNVVLSPLREARQEEPPSVTVPAPVPQGEGSLLPHSNEHVVILVHGIRDFALWQETVGRSLSQGGFRVEFTNYGRFDLFRFLVPLRYFRRKAIDEVLKQIRIAKQASGAKDISIIAHSFGTYVVSHILQENFDLKFRRIIFCGSVVNYEFPFEQFYHRFDSPILNEVGTRDIWPAMAESVTWGYGSAGTYGFRRPLVKDRWHNGAGHGFFLTPEFCNKYWLPFIASGRVVPASKNPERPRLWIQLLSIFRLKYVFLILCALAVASPFSGWLRQLRIWPQAQRLTDIHTAELRATNVDDFLDVYVNDNVVIENATYGAFIPWRPFRQFLRQGNNEIRAIVRNGEYGGCGANLEVRMNGVPVETLDRAWAIPIDRASVGGVCVDEKITFELR